MTRMTDEQVFDILKSTVKSSLEHATKEIMSNGESMMPHFIFVDGTGGVGVMFTPWDGDDEKVVMVEAVKSKFAEVGAIAYALVSETWYVSVKEGEPRPVGKPSDQPDTIRREMLMALLESSGKRLSITAEITREPTNVHPLVYKDMSNMEMEGLMTGLLPTRH